MAKAISNILKDFKLTKTNKRFSGTFINQEKVLANHYLHCLRDVPYLNVMKIIKLSICCFYSHCMRQEIPEGKPFKLFPQCIMLAVRTRLVPRYHFVNGEIKLLPRQNIQRKFRFLHSILQCKSALAGPKREHIDESYVKHAKTMSKPAQKTPQYILDYCFKVGAEFGKVVEGFYNPLVTKPPSYSATLTKKRSEGGQRGQLLHRIEEDFSSFRVEPTVLLLSGPPGCGKSRMVNEICRLICQIEHIDLKNSIYVRNCQVPHWDGYKGQFVTVLDDWAQDYQNQDDILEVVSLVTDNAYPLPMADLREKGALFSSKYLILCTNYRPNVANIRTMTGSNTIVLDYRAIFRRIDLGFDLIDGTKNDVTFTDSSRGLKLYSSEKTSGFQFSSNDLDRWYSAESTINRNDFIFDIAHKMCKSQLRKVCHILDSIPEIGDRYPWVQEISCISENIILPNGRSHRIIDMRHLEFPRYPPLEMPQVRTQSVYKALGSRMVTCAIEDSRVLKPFQEAMWKALGTYPKFQATHGLPLSEVIQQLGLSSKTNLKNYNKKFGTSFVDVGLKDDEYVLSGDYEGATDNFNMDFSDAILNGILSNISHEPTKKWAMWENGQHKIIYPPKTGIEPVIQTTGQLMGSLLSFPLLCLANDIVTSLAGIERKIINGDDLLGVCNDVQRERWTTIGTSCGLIPSIGKNYYSKDFGTFNSQLIVLGELIPYINLKLISREFQNLKIEDCFSLALKQGSSKESLVRNNRKLLRTDPRSLDIPVDFGGLGVSFDKKPTKQDKLCYLYALSHKHTKNILPNHYLPKGYVWLTYPVVEHATTELRVLKSFSESLKNKYVPIQTLDGLRKENQTALDCEISYQKLNKFKKQIIQNKEIRDFLDEGNLEFMPSFADIEFRTIPVLKLDFDLVKGKNLLNSFVNRESETYEVETKLQFLEKEYYNLNRLQKLTNLLNSNGYETEPDMMLPFINNDDIKPNSLTASETLAVRKSKINGAFALGVPRVNVCINPVDRWNSLIRKKATKELVLDHHNKQRFKILTNNVKNSEGKNKYISDLKRLRMDSITSSDKIDLYRQKSEDNTIRRYVHFD